MGNKPGKEINGSDSFYLDITPMFFAVPKKQQIEHRLNTAYSTGSVQRDELLHLQGQSGPNNGCHFEPLNLAMCVRVGNPLAKMVVFFITQS
ncbi:MAG: hypothetical protein GXO89_14810 [Chlorobi bacterium]|nr:hypothetical protein [Chlorobiota bacterium]